MNSYTLTVLLLFSNCAFAETQPAEPEPKETVQEKVEKTLEKSQEAVSTLLGQSQERRAQADYFGFLSYSPIDLLIPNKIGATVGLLRSAGQSWELEYLRGTISVPFLVGDLGEMKDERISLIGRSYFGNSFHLSYGLSYFRFSLHLGDDLLNSVSGGASPSIDLVSVESLGLNVGIGNRWTFKHNITLGLDWVSLYQPIVVTKREADYLDQSSSSKDRDKVDDALKLISYFPRLTLFKVQLGILF